jgi:hypothetical protein
MAVREVLKECRALVLTQRRDTNACGRCGACRVMLGRNFEKQDCAAAVWMPMALSDGAALGVSQPASQKLVRLIIWPMISRISLSRFSAI